MACSPGVSSLTASSLASASMSGSFSMLCGVPLTNIGIQAAKKPKACLLEIVKLSNKKGLFRGASRPVTMAIPQFALLGPVYKELNSKYQLGKWSTIGLLSTVESLVTYTVGKQSAQKFYYGKIIDHSLRPMGVGFGALLSRNVIAMAGLRILSPTIEDSLESIAKNSLKNSESANTGLKFTSNLLANCSAGAVSTIPHTIFNEQVINPERTIKKILIDQYKDNGISSLTKQASIRGARLGCVYTIFATLENKFMS
ncbi:hypothetical protein DID75_03545 [Candidatus Marinamargulisbacteria bacterium SCGC AG-410-N11]|nr:hypothetical protein DID75_03545 [Candidatus Marinamargulisbacteria bacterium SCGC AG-410-N11]